MLKSVNIYFTPKVDTKLKIDTIKEMGYDECFTGIDRTTENISLKKELKYIKKSGLKVTMIHCEYDGKILDNFWLDNKIGDKIVKDYSRQMKKAKGYSNNFVVHLNGSRNSITSEIGLNRVKKLLKIAKKCGFNLCVENLYSSIEIPYLFSNIKDDNLKICCDIGHQHCLTPNFEVLKDYGEYVSVLHIHDNNLLKDEHKILGTGSIDIEKLALDLANNKSIILSAEVKQKDDSDFIEYLKTNLNALKLLETTITSSKTN